MGCGSKRHKKRIKYYQPSRPQNDSPSIMVLPQIPQKCCECDADLDPNEVKWIGPLTIECPYCGASLHVDFTPVK